MLSYVFLVPNTASSEGIIQPVVPHVPNHVVSKSSKFSLTHLYCIEENVAYKANVQFKSFQSSSQVLRLYSSSVTYVLVKGGIEGEEHLLATLEMEASKHEEELLAEALLLQEELGVDLADHVRAFVLYIYIYSDFTTNYYLEPPYSYCIVLYIVCASGPYTSSIGIANIQWYAHAYIDVVRTRTTQTSGSSAGCSDPSKYSARCKQEAYKGGQRADTNRPRWSCDHVTAYRSTRY